MTIRHLVFSGGGPNMLSGYGILKTLHEEEFWKLEDIESITCTSAGAILAFFVLLKVKWEDFDDYLVKRSASNMFPFTPTMMFKAYSKRGIYQCHHFMEVFRPFLSFYNKSELITFEELYEDTNIDLNVICTDVNKMEIVILNHKNTPKIPVVHGVFASSSIPPVFSPLIYEDKCLLDGGLLANYPLIPFFDLYPDADKNEILGIKPKYVECRSNINEESTISQYIFCILQRIINKCDKSVSESPKLKHEAVYESEGASSSTWSSYINDESFREKMIKKGCKSGKQFLSNLKQCSKTVQEPDE